ncbi:MAG: DNA alkylation repair protein, partial [Spirochaetes bacterium]|nr:DNA alkylation repair protein [Spirochaetota bacterium]
MTHQEIINHLLSLADKKTAEHSQYFFKTGEGEYGYGDKFLGIRVPVIRDVVKKFKNTPLSAAKKLLKSE